jgi:hypothetical protein
MIIRLQRKKIDNIADENSDDQRKEQNEAWVNCVYLMKV